jgi:hypothetical protein
LDICRQLYGSSGLASQGFFAFYYPYRETESPPFYKPKFRKATAKTGAEFIFDCFIFNSSPRIVVLLPEKCSIKVEGVPCQLAPSYVVSVASEHGEYMLAVVCDEHKDVLQGKLALMQKEARIPSGRIKFESIKTVTTDCVVGMNEDYVDIELARGVESDRKLT